MTDITAARLNIQQEEVDYRSAVSESMLSKIGGSINWLNANAADQIGDLRSSFLTETQFQTQRGTGWVLCDGRDVTGSDYETLTGSSNIPDVRGRFMRMKDNGRSLDPQGDAALGAGRSDTYKSHVHQEQAHDGVDTPGAVNPIQYTNDLGTTDDFEGLVSTPSQKTGAASLFPLNTVASGSSETAPLHIVCNYFIRINA